MSPILSLLIAFTTILINTSSQNTYTGDGKNIWQSTSDFTLEDPKSYGNIRIGTSMRMEFDLLWYGRTLPISSDKWEHFFRVGFDAANGFDCDAQSSRYPSLWLRPESNVLHISVSNKANCNVGYDISDTPLMNGQTYHLVIQYTQTRILIYMDNVLKHDKTRVGTDDNYIGDIASIWIPSSRAIGSFIHANATLSNIILTSSMPTTEPTLDPTRDPTSYPTNVPSGNPTANPTYIPTNYPTANPTLQPSAEPTSEPTMPSLVPTVIPTTNPTTNPTINPTTSPLPEPIVMLNESTKNMEEVNDEKTVKQQQQDNGLKLEIVALIIGAFVLSALVFVVGICCMMQRKLRKEKEQTNREMRDIRDPRDIREVKSDSELPMDGEMPKTPPLRIHIATTSNSLVLDKYADTDDDDDDDEDDEEEEEEEKKDEEINDDHQDDFDDDDDIDEDGDEMEETKEVEIEETKETEMEETLISDLSRMSDLEKVLNNDVLLEEVLHEVEEDTNYGLSTRVIGVSTNSLNVPEMLSDGEESAISELETVECHTSTFNERVSREKKKRKRSRKRKPSKKRKRKQRETHKQQENETYYE